MDYDKKMPCSTEAEQALIGSVLISPECMSTVAQIVNYDDFYNEEHRVIFAAIERMFLQDSNMDEVTLLDELKQRGELKEAGGEEYLLTIVRNTPDAVNAVDYANIVHGHAVRRKLIEAAEKISEDAYSEAGTVEELVSEAERRISDISQGVNNESFVSIRKALLAVNNQLQAVAENPDAMKGTPTGYKAIDDLLVGLGSNDLVIVGGRPGMGKTSFAMNIAVQVALNLRKKVCVFSLEMNPDQLVERMISSEALIDLKKMKSGKLTPEDWQSIARATEKLAGADILIDGSSTISVSSMKAKLQRERDNLGLVVVDYLQLLEPDGVRRNDTRATEVGAISRGLKQLARSLEVPVLCCAQLKRETDKGKKRPMLSDLRESGNIEQDADIVLFLYREEYYDNELAGSDSTAEIIVAKNRHGAPGTVRLGWMANFTKFVNQDYKTGE